MGKIIYGNNRFFFLAKIVVYVCTTFLHDSYTIILIEQMTDKERRLTPSVSPRCAKVIIGMAAAMEIKKSRAAANLIEQAVNSMSERERKQYLEAYHNKNKY